MYRCDFCGYSVNAIHKFVPHYKHHQTVPNFSYPCNVEDCKLTFKNYASYKSHMHRKHHKRQVVTTTVTNISCQVNECNYKAVHLNGLIKHLTAHVRAGVGIKCPYKDCKNTFTVRSTFSSHVSRKHRVDTVNDLSDSVCSRVPCENTNLDSGDLNVSHSDTEFLHEPDDPDIISSDHYLHNLATFYLKLQAKFLLPARVIQDIIMQFQCVHDIGQTYLFDKLKKSLSNAGVDDNITEAVLEEMAAEDLLHKFNSGPLRSEKTRKTFFETHFNYVAPRSVYLGEDSNSRKRYLQYIPIHQTLQTLFEHESVKEQYHATHSQLSEHGIYRDVCDGSVFKENVFFNENPSALRLILYQDAFEVANPLGSGRKKHKVLGVYLTLADLMPHSRSSIDHMQLVMLIREQDFKKFGQDICFRCLINDLITLETDGIPLSLRGTEEMVKGTLVVITGDNLGSHSIGGFTENFSRSHHFCRFCRIDRTTFNENPCAVGAIRTPESYDNVVEDLGDEPNTLIIGVKFSSLFNQLKYFHVAQPGLPPCLAHDLFEGVVSKDMALYINHFIKREKVLTYSQLNRLIGLLKYLGSDADNKPAEVPCDGEKLGGHAVQNWCLLKLIPILLKDRIEDPANNSVWKLVLSLREIVMYICAPSITTDQVAELQSLIEDYMLERVAMFPEQKLRPKHHYLLHYPQLIIQLGPMIRLWTMRFESKHTFFKECARKLKNFKHLTLTLAGRHQLLQAYFHAGSFFSPTINATHNEDFTCSMYNDKVQRSVRLFGLESHNTIMSNNMTYKGTAYKKNMVVILNRVDDGFIVGKIMMILNQNKLVYFVCEILHALFLIDMGLHCIVQEQEPDITCVEVDTLLDYYPLPIYNKQGMMLVALHHAVNHATLCKI